jgi:hypothetical protein
LVGGGRPLRAVDSGADRRNDDDDGVDDDDESDDDGV